MSGDVVDLDDFRQAIVDSREDRVLLEAVHGACDGYSAGTLNDQQFAECIVGYVHESIARRRLSNAS